MDTNPGIKSTEPVNLFDRPLDINYKDLFTGLSKGISHIAIGKWEDVATDTVETFAALGLTTKPGELAFLLINRSVFRAVFDLVGESVAGNQLIEPKENADLVTQKLENIISHEKIYLDRTFLDRPSEIPAIKHLKASLQLWLEEHGINQPAAKAIINRLPSYFVYALNQEWRRNAKNYSPLIDALNTPFAKASERDWAWTAYSALLQRRIQEGIFDESFSLNQIFIPLNAYYVEETKKELSDDMSRDRRQHKRIVISLQQELEQWLDKNNPQDAIRVISGGPGSGKSSFARVFAAKVANKGKLKVLFVPLHLIDATKDLVDEIGRFANDEGVLSQNPLNPEDPEPNLFIIFDGLDELASQGKAAAETARSFIREVEKTIEKRNLQSVKLRVLISGRELIVQENESEFRRPRQVLNLLPYFVPTPSDGENKEYDDANNLLKDDLRQKWWKNYGILTGNGYMGLPKELSRNDLDEITAQPLLNYLVALSFTRDKLDFTKDINLNSIYDDLVAAVHERGYEKHRPFAPIRHMKLNDFERVLEEVGLAAWHGDGRTTTVREIEEHCRASGVGLLLDAFKEGATAGVTRLLAAFFFRQYGQRTSGDPTFVFTHKSFGEYLAARRIVRTIERVSRELERRSNDPDEGWDERDALKHWAQICGPSAISPYLHTFLIDEIKLRSINDVTRWQLLFTRLFNYMLRHGTPMEQLQIVSFKETLFQSRNAEEALLVALNACARATSKVSEIEHPDQTSFATWFKRIQGQRIGGESALAAKCLSFLELGNIITHMIDFYAADLYAANLENLQAAFACFSEANLTATNLKNAELSLSSLRSAHLNKANLEEARLMETDMSDANLGEANLQQAKLQMADLQRANLQDANLQGADLQRANLQRANLQRANLQGANLQEANLQGANLQEAKLQGINLVGTKLKGTILEKQNKSRKDKDI